MFCISEKNKPVSPVCRTKVLKEKQFIIHVTRMFSLIPLCEGCVIILQRNSQSFNRQKIWICAHVIILDPPQQNIYKVSTYVSQRKPLLMIFSWLTAGKNKQIKAEMVVSKQHMLPRAP